MECGQFLKKLLKALNYLPITNIPLETEYNGTSISSTHWPFCNQVVFRRTNRDISLFPFGNEFFPLEH